MNKINCNALVLNYLEKQVLTTIFDKGEINSEETAKLINRLKDLNLIEWNGTSKFDTKGKYIIKKIN